MPAVTVTAVDPTAVGFSTTWDGTVSIGNWSFGNVDVVSDLTNLFLTATAGPARVNSDRLMAGAREYLATPPRPTIIGNR